MRTVRSTTRSGRRRGAKGMTVEGAAAGTNAGGERLVRRARRLRTAIEGDCAFSTRGRARTPRGTRGATSAAPAGGTAPRAAVGAPLAQAAIRPRSGASVLPVRRRDHVGGVVEQHRDAASSIPRSRSSRGCARGCARRGRASAETRAGPWRSGGGRRPPPARTARATRSSVRARRGRRPRRRRSSSVEAAGRSSIARRKIAAPPVAPNTSIATGSPRRSAGRPAGRPRCRACRARCRPS